MKTGRIATILILIALAAREDASAQRNDGLPEVLDGVGVSQRLGETIPLDDVFVDSTGRETTLGELVAERPVILAPVYYDCPMLCNMTLDGVARSVLPLKLTAGSDFDIVAVSFAPEEDPELASRAKKHLFERVRTQRDGWHFLTGGSEEIARLTEQIGFSYRYIEENGEWAHSAAIMIVTPDGRLSRYFYGIDYPPRDLRLALVEASGGGIGSLADQVLLYCYRYDPATGKYTFAVWAAVRAGGVATAIGLVAFLLFSLRRDRRGRDPVTA